MDSFFLLTSVTVVIGLFTLLGTILLMVKNKFIIPQDNKDLDSSSSPPPSSLSSSSPLSSLATPSSLSSSSPTSSCNLTHHVFPSFRGEDVRRNFLSHIQKEFRRKGITPFIDNEIKRGESIGPELIRAIRGSKIAIVLLSKNYASSKWCLNELVEIMNCKKEFGQTVFAIFYDVDPSHVKKLTGEFGAVFEKTCKGKTKEEIGRWRQAFAEVATIAGYDSRNWENESVMIEEIVTEISKRLINSTPSRDFIGLIGMEAHMEKMKLMLCLGSEEQRTIGISGPSGIGKTTIARVLHNQISDGFQLSVFMKFKPSYARPPSSDDHDVKLHLEQQLLAQLMNQEDLKIRHLGTAQHLLMDKRVLIVLDGVDQSIQLRAMPKARCLGLGTRIIITTQDQKLLKAFEVKHIYNVNFPPPDEALQIFCMYAFGQNFPKDGFKNFAWEVTNLAGRLPLGLRVMGSHLQGMSKQEWKAELPRLRVRLDGEIGSILKLSYDALDDEDKNLFLHIACFFNDEGMFHTFEGALENIFLDVKQGLRVLIQKSLIPDEKSRPMHNLLVELGREIVRNQSIYEPGKRQFLVNAREICEVLTNDRGSKSVIGINFNLLQIEHKLNISESAFEEMSNLQFLRFIYYDENCNRLYLPQGLNNLPPRLRILHWDGYPIRCLPSKFNPKFLVKICMRYSKLEKLWEGIQPLINLKVMDLSYSTNLKKLPDLSTAINLLELQLVSCQCLVELPTCIGNLINLKALDFSKCSSLVELPSFTRNAKNFTALSLRGCSSLKKLPSSIGNATNLKEIDLLGCLRLVELPSSIGDIINLERLILRDCLNLMEIPSSIIGKIINLRKLDLTRCSRLMELSSSIGNIINLRILDLCSCSRLVRLPSSIGDLVTLRFLNFAGCLSLVELPESIGNLINLESLRLVRCSNLVELPSSIGNLINLLDLDLANCSSLVDLPCSIGKLTTLRQLYLNDCSNLLELPSSIGNITNLWRLQLKGCSNLVELPCSIGNLIYLIDLDLSHCSNLVELPSSIGNLINLQDLNLANCSSLVDLPCSIGKLTTLRELYLDDCSNLLELPSSIGNITNLWSLHLKGCSNLVELPCSIGNLINLIGLDLSHCSKLVKLPSSIGNIITLKNLYISGCSNLVELPSSYGNTTISPQKLDLNGCSNLVELPSSIGNAIILQKLDLNGCLSLVKIPSSIGKLCKLTNLSLRGCSKLKVLPANINLNSLKELDVTGCSELKSFPEISTNIERLMLCGTLIKEIPLSIKSWSRLHDLRITYCKELEEFPHVLDVITELEINNTTIDEVPPWVNGISHLRRLLLNKCWTVISLPRRLDPLISFNTEKIESLERIVCSFPNPQICLNSGNLWDLMSDDYFTRYAILPGRKVPAFFTHRATTGGTLTVKLNQSRFPTSLRFKACILLVNKDNKRAAEDNKTSLCFSTTEKLSGRIIKMPLSNFRILHPLLTEHLYIFEHETGFVEFNELFFEFKVDSDYWEIGECGVREILEEDPDVHSFIMV